MQLNVQSTNAFQCMHYYPTCPQCFNTVNHPPFPWHSNVLDRQLCCLYVWAPHGVNCLNTSGLRLVFIVKLEIRKTRYARGSTLGWEGWRRLSSWRVVMRPPRLCLLFLETLEGRCQDLDIPDKMWGFLYRKKIYRGMVALRDEFPMYTLCIAEAYPHEVL